MTNQKHHKNFIYLMQGQAQCIKKYLHLNSETSDCIFLTFDEEIEDAIFFPNSTWTEGRNRLIQEAKALDKEYLYYILLDDDVSFIKGSFQLMEENLLKYKPALGTPCVDSDYTRGPGMNFGEDMEVQRIVSWDEPYDAYHHTVFHDTILLPYDTKFDPVCWWGQCDINRWLLYTLYHDYILQFNNCCISNDLHRDYPNKTYSKDFNLMSIGNYVQEQLSIPLQLSQIHIGDPASRYVQAQAHIKRYSPKESYFMAIEEKQKIFKQESPFYQRCCNVRQPSHLAGESLKNLVYKHPSALYFDGLSDRIKTVSLLNNLSAFTLEGWIKPASNPVAGASLFGQHNVIEFGLFYRPQQGIEIGVVTAQGGFLAGTYPYPINEWHHVALVGDEGNLLIYVDSIKITSRRYTTKHYGSSNYGSSTASFQIGAGAWHGEGNLPFHGEMAEVRVWNRARTDLEIQRDMPCYLSPEEPSLLAYYRFDQGQIILDCTGNGHNALVLGNPQRTASPIVAVAPEIVVT